MDRGLQQQIAELAVGETIELTTSEREMEVVVTRIDDLEDFYQLIVEDEAGDAYLVDSGKSDDGWVQLIEYDRPESSSLGHLGRVEDVGKPSEADR